MLRVLTLSTLFPNGGQTAFGIFVERQTMALAALDGVDVKVIAPVAVAPWPLSLHPHYRPRTRLPVKENWDGLAVHRPRYLVYPRVAEPAAGRSLARAVEPLVRRLHAQQPFDVIAAQFFWPDGVAAMHLARALGLPFSIKARGADIHYWGSRDGVSEQIVEAGREAAGLLAVSEALKQDMVQLGIPEDKVEVHYTGVDFDRFRSIDRASAKAELGVDGPLLVTVGALIPRKAQRLTLEALALLPGASLLVVGDGPDRAMLERFARDRGLASRVRFLGSRPEAEVARLLAAADIMLLPSASEGLANVWVEALACGTPLVISEAGGAREVVRDRAAGRIVARDAAAIADAVREILADPPEAAAVKKAAERFSWAANAEALRRHLERIVNRAA